MAEIQNSEPKLIWSFKAGAPPAAPPVTKETTVKTQPLFRVVTDHKTGTTLIPVNEAAIRLPPTFRAGSGSVIPTNFVPVNAQEEVRIGDILRLTYRLQLPVLTDWQKNHIVTKIGGDSRFELLDVATLEQERRVILTVKVLQPFSPILLVAAAIIAALVGAGLFLTLEAVTRAVLPAEGQSSPVAAGLGLLGLATLAAGALFLFWLMKHWGK